MSKQIVHTPDAPAAVGPYSQAVIAPPGHTIYASGQIALDPVSGELIRGDVATQAKQVMKNLEAVLRESGSGFEEVVKCTIYLRDMADYAAVNEVYASYFEGMQPPARACVAVAGLPKDVDVEIDAIAVRG